MANLKYPPNVQWEVTSECNHNCIHCYNYWRNDNEKKRDMTKFLSKEEYLQIAEKLVQQKPVSVVITGGEPLLVFDRIKDSMDVLLNNGIFVSINTNAALLNKEKIPYLKSRGIGLFVSFPCIEENIFETITSTKDSYKRVISALDMAYSNNIHFGINVVASNLNLEYVKDTAEFIKNRYNLSTISITRVGKPSNSDESFNKFLLKKEEIAELQEMSVWVNKNMSMDVTTSCPYTACSIYSKEAFELFGYTKICTAGKTSYAIDVDGNVKACPRDSHLYGNILVEDFPSIWNNMCSWRNGDYIPDDCKKCASLNKCLGGCRVDALPFTGKLNCMDTAADTANIPVKYTTKSKQILAYNMEDAFKVSEKVRFVEDEVGYRVSSSRKYLYITQELFSFLSENKDFTMQKLSTGFGEPYDVIIHVINMLMDNNIVYKTE